MKKVSIKLLSRKVTSKKIVVFVADEFHPCSGRSGCDEFSLRVAEEMEDPLSFIFSIICSAESS